MDWLTFISKFIESMAWPVAVVLLGLIFRKEVAEMLPFLRKVKAGPLEAEFEAATEQLLASTAELTVTERKPGIPLIENMSSLKDTASMHLAARSEPTATIIEGWSKLDGELHQLGRQTGVNQDPLISQTKLYREIMDSEVLPKEIRSLVQDLRYLRNQVAHSKFFPTPESAQNYLVLVESVVELIRNYRKNLPGYNEDVE